MIGVGNFKISARARRYVNDVLTSERLSYGPYTQKFERLFAAAHDCRFAIMTNSGTCSLLIALAALKNKGKWADGDEVILPAVTFIATSNIVLQLNLKPVFVDIDPIYYELDPDKIEAAITPRTRCIIPVHLFGLPCEMEKISAIARRHGLRMIEDSCETMFTRYQGKSVGSFGDIGCFSTYVAHLLVTGVGGLCTTNDPELAIALRSLMNHGRDSIYISIDDDKNKSKEEMELIIQRRFSFIQMGYSFRVTEMEGALGLAEFEEREEMLAKRRANGAFFQSRLKHLQDKLQLPRIRPESGHAFMMFPIVLKNEPKQALVRHLEERGIETRDMLPLINQPFYRELFGDLEEKFPVAKWINKNGFYIASHQSLTEIEKEYIVDVFTGYFKKRAVLQEKSCLVLMSKNAGRAAELMYESLPVDTFDDKVVVEASKDEGVPAFYRAKGYRVLHEAGGKGELLAKAVASTNCENIVVLGLDGADDPRDIDSVLIRLKQGCDVVVASRFMSGGGRETTRALSYRSIGNRFFSFLISVIFSRNVTDSNNLFRGFKKTAFEALRLREHGESMMFEMTLLTLESRLKLEECPTVERPAVAKGVKRNRLLSALSFFWILTKYVVGPSTGGRKRAQQYALLSGESAAPEARK